MTHDGGEGALKYKKDQRRRGAMVLASIVIALAAGGAMIIASEIERSGGGLSRSLSILLALLFVGGFIAANWVYLRNVDELEWANNISAGFWSLMVLVILFPAWRILWMGSIVPEPTAEGIYLITVGSAGIVYIWRRIRQYLF